MEELSPTSPAASAAAAANEDEDEDEDDDGDEDEDDDRVDDDVVDDEEEEENDDDDDESTMMPLASLPSYVCQQYDSFSLRSRRRYVSSLSSVRKDERFSITRVRYIPC